MVPQGPAARVGGQEGALGQAAHVPEPLVPQVGDVGQHPQSLHLGQKGPAGLRQAPGLAVGGSQLVGVVPGEGEQTDPQPVEGTQQGELAPAHASLLHRQQGAQFARPAGLLQVGKGQDGLDQVGVGRHLLPVQVGQGEDFL